MTIRIIQLALGGLVLASLLGCGDRVGPWGTVTGVVSCQGQPVEPAIVLFSNRQIGVEMTAETDASGRFTVRTDRINGLPVGNYRVAVMPKPTNLPMPEQGMMFTGPAPRPAPSNIPEVDRDINTTRLSAVVNEGTNEFTFHLQQ
jgi:hypothetical protein